MATQTVAVEPFDRIDQLTSSVGRLQNELVSICADANRQHQEIDARYAPEVNPRLAELQAALTELRSLAEAHRDELLPRGKKSSKRNTGTIGWRSVPRVVRHVSDGELIATIRARGQSAYRKLVRRTISHELNLDAFTTLANRELVAGIPGVELDLRDDFYVVPNGGLRFSTAMEWWPAMNGLPLPLLLQQLTSGDTA